MSKLISIRSLAMEPRNDGKELEYDDEGYCKYKVGALGVTATDGAHYNADEEVLKLFSSTGILASNAKNGHLHGEITHPKPQPGQTLEQYKGRILNTDYKLVCVTFKEIWIEKQPDNTYLIWAWLKPFGPHSKTLEDGLKDKNINISFSIRCLVNERWIGGKLFKTITVPVTFDLVIRPGIPGSNKFGTVSIEDNVLAVIDVENQDEINNIINCIKTSGIGTESDNTAVIDFLSAASKNTSILKNESNKMDDWL